MFEYKAYKFFQHLDENYRIKLINEYLNFVTKEYLGTF